MGKIAVEGMSFYAYHGYYDEEQKLGGQYIVDVYIDYDFSIAADNDTLENTINYEQVFKIAQAEMNIKARLLEHLGKRIIERIKKDFSAIEHIKVRISKINPPLNGSVNKVFIEIEK